MGKLFDEISRSLIQNRKPDFANAPEPLSKSRIEFIHELNQKILQMENRTFELQARIEALKELRNNLKSQRNRNISDIVNETLIKHSILLSVGTTNDLLKRYAQINDISQSSTSTTRMNGPRG